jgi:hypothetical protein
MEIKIKTFLFSLGKVCVFFRWEISVVDVLLGRKSIKNLAGRPAETKATRAVSRLTKEFGGDAG